MRRAIKLSLLLLLACAALGGQELIYEKYPEGVDLWVLIPYNSLLFRQDADAVEYQLTLEIKNQATRQTWNFEQVIPVLKRDWLQNTALPVYFQAELDPGKHQALLRLKNLATGGKTDLKRTFSVGEAFTEIGQPYLLVLKEGISFIPSDLGKLPVPVENCGIRQKFSAAIDSVHITLRDSLLYILNPEREIRSDLTRFVNNDSAGNLAISFFEGNIRYNMAPFLFNQWFTYNARYSYKEQIQQLRYIANQNEWKSIRSVPEDMYQEVIDRFWQVHDPSPGTLRNEARESFYQRVITADERFTVHKRLKGWSSDRGRIYIKYGEPDEIYSEVHPIDLYPFIIWYYYGQNLEFVFSDTGGFGQFRLRNKDEEY
ncbi:MAG: GWxTD domain-containing protein [Candidatus Syntrophosphaera sp.]|nr:GWxTD domain-containing protein [Candidatus Syntrophosphaera sp.]